MEELELGLEVGRADYLRAYGDGRHRERAGAGGIETSSTESTLGGRIERCGREEGRRDADGEMDGRGHGEGDVKGGYQFEEVAVGR